MCLFERYIFRATFSAFSIVLVSLTAIVWVTQALHNFDLITNQGQTVLVFLSITGLIIPLIVLVIAPVAMVIAAAHVLNKLSADSEVIVMNASGTSPWLLFRAFMMVALVVSFIVAFMSAYFAPKCLRMLRDSLTQVNANVVNSFLQSGRFVAIEGGKITIHIRERRPNGQLINVMLDDRRNPLERITILAAGGELLEKNKHTFLVLINGTVQRHAADQRDLKMLAFDQYAFDLSQFDTGLQAVKYSIRERYLWQLLFPDSKDALFVEQPNQFRAEMHDRLMAAVYPVAFMMIAFAYLGAPRTTRQSRTIAMLGVIGGVGLLRLIGFASTVFGATLPWMLLLQYIAIALTIILGIWAIHRGLTLDLPSYIVSRITMMTKRVSWFQFHSS